jgi:hypothetical protein
MAADFAAGGMPVATAIRKALKFGVGSSSERKLKQQIAALLSNTDPAAIRELAAELRAKAEKRGLASGRSTRSPMRSGRVLWLRRPSNDLRLSIIPRM